MMKRTRKEWADVLLDTAVSLEMRGRLHEAEWYLLNALRDEKRQKDQAEMLEIERDWRN